MRYLYTVFALILLLAGCDSDTNEFSLNANSAKKCVEPQNPYDEGGGHYAGFEWAAASEGTCDGNSDSFNEGCEEYFQQLDKYNKCIAKRHRIIF